MPSVSKNLPALAVGSMSINPSIRTTLVTLSSAPLRCCSVKGAFSTLHPCFSGTGFFFASFCSLLYVIMYASFRFRWQASQKRRVRFPRIRAPHIWQCISSIWIWRGFGASAPLMRGMGEEVYSKPHLLISVSSLVRRKLGLIQSSYGQLKQPLPGWHPFGSVSIAMQPLLREAFSYSSRIS